MKFSQRVELVDKYNIWRTNCNKTLKEKGDIARIADVPLSVITFLDNKGYLSDRQRWIPVSEGLPKDLEPVNITWVNHNPESYYADIKDKPFTATGVYFNGQWYWWSTLCTDILAAYSHNYDDIIDDDIEITAWKPLPEPYKAESEDKE